MQSPGLSEGNNLLQLTIWKKTQGLFPDIYKGFQTYGGQLFSQRVCKEGGLPSLKVCSFCMAGNLLGPQAWVDALRFLIPQVQNFILYLAHGSGLPFHAHVALARLQES